MARYVLIALLLIMSYLGGYHEGRKEAEENFKSGFQANSLELIDKAADEESILSGQNLDTLADTGAAQNVAAELNGDSYLLRIKISKDANKEKVNDYLESNLGYKASKKGSNIAYVTGINSLPDALLIEKEMETRFKVEVKIIKREKKKK